MEIQLSTTRTDQWVYKHLSEIAECKLEAAQSPRRCAHLAAPLEVKSTGLGICRLSWLAERPLISSPWFSQV